MNDTIARARFGTTGLVLALLAVFNSSGRLTGTSGSAATVPIQAVDSVKVLLAEVLFMPAPGDAAFVELANVGDKAVDADRLTANIKGPASEFTIELLFARDEKRTPIRALIPVAIGKFTVEFSR